MHLLLPLVTLTALRVPGPLSPRNASYAIHATLDEKDKTVSGKERLTWRNIARGAADSLVLHLYMNAFKNDQSTFMKEAKSGAHRGNKRDERGWGAIDVTKIVVGGVDLTRQFAVDDTLATVKLPQPVAPGASVDVDIDFSVKLPKVFARTGYRDDFFAVGQWFPKVGVFDCEPGPYGASGCRWRAHQHHLNSEFFADYGVYDVDVDVPKDWVVGASGVLVSEKTAGARKTVAYHAEDVHDFVWTTSPKFKVTEDKLSDASGEIRIVMLSQPGRDANVPRHLRATREGLMELERRFGVYPYSQITVVDVPEGAEGAGGMEYPTLFFTGDVPVPPGLHLPEDVTIHELSHQYFYGLVGSDEVEEAWLDEGFTETMTDWGLDRMFGRDAGAYDYHGHRLSAVAMEQASYRSVVGIDALDTRSFDFESVHGYFSTTYPKTVLVLRTMEAYLGAPRFEAAMRHYYDKARFGHPRGDDFVRWFDEGAGEDLMWYWRPALFGTEALDYQILEVVKRRKLPPTGLFDEGGKRVEKQPPKRPEKDAPWISEVVVHRKGELVFPVELKVVFEDGSSKRESWDGGKPGEPRWRRWTYETPKPVAYAEIDPDNKVALDVARWNNAKRVEADSGPRRQLVGWFQHTLSTLLSTVGF